MNALPPEDAELLASILNKNVTGFTFCGMQDCGESIVEECGKYAQANYGVVFHFADEQDVAFTWGSNDDIGDPFYLSVIRSDELLSIDALDAKPCSNTHPWSKFVGEDIRGISVHSYSTHPDDPGVPHQVPWAVEIEFGNAPKLLVGAIKYQDVASNAYCADEILILFDGQLIVSAVQSRRDAQAD